MATHGYDCLTYAMGPRIPFRTCVIARATDRAGRSFALSIRTSGAASAEASFALDRRDALALGLSAACLFNDFENMER